jgi:hypothetical protein
LQATYRKKGPGIEARAKFMQGWNVLSPHQKIGASTREIIQFIYDLIARIWCQDFGIGWLAAISGHCDGHINALGRKRLREARETESCRN